MTSVYSGTHRIKQPKISTHNQICTQNISAPSVRGSESTWQMLTNIWPHNPQWGRIELSLQGQTDRLRHRVTQRPAPIQTRNSAVPRAPRCAGYCTQALSTPPSFPPTNPQHKPLACELTPGFYLQYLKWPFSSCAVRELFNQMKLSVRTNGFLCKTLGVNDHALRLLGANLVHDNCDPLTIPNPGLSLINLF